MTFAKVVSISLVEYLPLYHALDRSRSPHSPCRLSQARQSQKTGRPPRSREFLSQPSPTASPPAQALLQPAHESPHYGQAHRQSRAALPSLQLIARTAPNTVGPSNPSAPRG